MPDYRVIPYSPDRLPELEALWREHSMDEDAVARRRRYFEWLTEGNPFRLGSSPYYLLTDGNRVIGMHGHMPQQLSVQGKPQRFFLAHDDLLAVECRGKGLGAIMLNGVADQEGTFAGALWHNAPNLKLYAKCGWTDLSKLTVWALIVDPRRNLEARLGRNPLAGALAWALRKLLALRLDLVRAGRSTAYRVHEIQRFDAPFDALFARTAPALPLAVTRDAAYLNWKFVAKPDNRYRRLAAFDPSGTLRAYAVLSAGTRGGEPVGTVLDLLGEPGYSDALDAVIRRGLDWLRSEGVVEVSCVGSDRALSCLERFGFRPRPSPTGFMLRNGDSVVRPGFVGNIDNWYITGSDADGDAWTAT